MRQFIVSFFTNNPPRCKNARITRRCSWCRSLTFTASPRRRWPQALSAQNSASNILWEVHPPSTNIHPLSGQVSEASLSTVFFSVQHWVVSQLALRSMQPQSCRSCRPACLSLTTVVTLRKSFKEDVQCKGCPDRHKARCRKLSPFTKNPKGGQNYIGKYLELHPN